MLVEGDGRIGEMDARVLEVRNLTYGMFVELCRAPSLEEVAGAADLALLPWAVWCTEDASSAVAP